MDKVKDDLENQSVGLGATSSLYKIILDAVDINTVVQNVSDIIPRELDFATGVVAIVDEKKGTIRRIAASKTKEAEEAIKAIKIPFNQIEISISDPNNLMAKAVREQKSFITTDTYDVLGPVLNRQETKKIQEIMQTKTTVVYPIISKNRTIGVFLASTKKPQDQLTKYELEIIRTFVEGAGIALEHALIFEKMKSLTEKLESANKRLKEIDELKDEFVSIASHELRTPMTTIKSYLWLVLDRAKNLDEKTRKDLQRAYDSTERTIVLVKDMLTVSRIEGRRLEINLNVFDLRELVKQVYEELKIKANEKQIKFIFDQISETLKIKADIDKIREVLQNLISNALKFTPEKGTVKISFRKTRGTIETSISDTGMGISKNDLPKLFQKFSRLGGSLSKMAETPGTGLGLYIAKQIVSLHGGKILVKSKEREGSTFTFSLPEVKEEK